MCIPSQVIVHGDSKTRRGTTPLHAALSPLEFSYAHGTRRGPQQVSPLYLNYGVPINNGMCVATFGNLSRNTIIMMANTPNYGRM